MSTLRATAPHFIRCIIPNEVKTPGIACYGTQKDKYLILAATAMLNATDDKTMAKACMDAIEMDPERYRLGHTKACN
ncbi:Myosin-13 [Orchesella cincta]|uniref:Myosin-13 n=1 Tax=Orchesella cincta TaxID=48709 RepID=A0A1D2M8F0_ORCCI|nr:Myosin-13 [Orchesella cincta]